MRRLAVAVLAAALLQAAPAEASGRVVHPAYSFEVPGGWKASKATMKPLDTVKLTPDARGFSGTALITVTTAPPGAAQLAGPLPPSWAKQGATVLGGAPARTALWETSRAGDKGPVAVSIRIAAERAGRPHVIMATYTKAEGDVQADRRFNVALSVVVRSWRWSR